MIAPEFIDSNIWLYALLSGQDKRKSEIAKDLTLAEPRLISTQVINEVCVNLIRKDKYSEESIRKLITSFISNHILVEIGEEVLVEASRIRSMEHSFSYWDSLIVSSSILGNAETLYSEDMQDGFVVDNKLKIVNPFKN